MKLGNMFSFVSALSGVNRFSMAKLSHPENVLEHTGMVCIFTYILTHHVNERLTPNSQINIGETMTKAVVHDFDEVITGDIPRPTKYFSKELRQCFTELERIGLQKIAKLIEVPEVIVNHRDSKSGPAGFIVATADLLAATHRVWEEVLVYNNMHLVTPAQHMRNALIRMHEQMPIVFSHDNSPFDRALCSVLQSALVEGIANTFDRVRQEYSFAGGHL